MKAGVVKEILKVTSPTLLKRVDEYKIPVGKSPGGDNLYSWANIAQLYQRVYFPKPKKFVLSLCQNKGGVGKTTSTINLGYLFSCIGKTLLIDLDGQANLSQAFQIYKSSEDLSVKDVLDSPDKISGAIENIDSNLDLLPNTNSFEIWKRTSNSKRIPQYLLQKALNGIKDQYDFILIDCAPGMDISFDMALYASDNVLIFMEPHPFSTENIVNTISQIKSLVDDDITGLLKDKLKVLGVVFSRYTETVLSRNNVEQAEETDLKVFNTKIRNNIQIPESQALKKPVFLHEENCNGSKDYFSLWVEIMGEING